MKGVLFNVVEDVVTTTLPGHGWDDALADTGLAGAYTSLGDYPDADLDAIVGAMADRYGLPPEEVLRHAGREGYAHLAGRHADLLDGITTYGELLHHLDAVIHPEVRKLYPRASVPTFEVVDVAPDRWDVRYRSARGLCHLAEGLLEGAARAFDASASTSQSDCVHRGDDSCLISVVLESGNAST